MMINTALHCPLPNPIESSSEVVIELKSLIDYLQTDRPIAQKIVFPRGTVMPDGRLDLCKQDLGVMGCHLVTEALANNDAIASLLLGTNGIGDLGAKDVARLIQRNNRLEIVYLGCNAISSTGIAALAEALTHNQSVTGLWLKRNPIGVAGAYYLAEMLRHNTSIRTLDLVNTQIGNEGLAAILEVLTYTNRTVERLYLGGNQIQANQAALLANLLAENPVITGLFLNVNHLGDRGVTVLAGGLAENKTPLDLGLASNGIGVEGCEELLAALQTHPAIGNLDLGYSPSTQVLKALPNQIGDIGASAIANFLRDNQTLFKLNLAKNGITEGGKIALITALETNRKLRYLILDGQPDRRIEVLLERNRMLNLGDELHKPRSVASIQSVYR
ncbi:ribonuclease inhibitor [Microcoleus sp. ARI1-B5]|uniref:ribonuclease inhibitor n=1 Tax=unclassified Microcoleus TaxID=2642155 RepID=UPI002FCEE9AA